MSSRTLDVADVARALSTNGRVHATTAVLDPGRATRIQEILVDAVDRCPHFGRNARTLWLQHIDQLTPLIAQSGVSESTTKRRAREFFAVEWWVDKAELRQVGALRDRMLKPTRKADE
jgi:hypothetical protein